MKITCHSLGGIAQLNIPRGRHYAQKHADSVENRELGIMSPGAHHNICCCGPVTCINRSCSLDSPFTGSDAAVVGQLNEQMVSSEYRRSTGRQGVQLLDLVQFGNPAG